jgi:hypothetical protein
MVGSLFFAAVHESGCGTNSRLTERDDNLSKHRPTTETEKRLVQRRKRWCRWIFFDLSTHVEHTLLPIIEKLELSFQFIMGQFDLARATEVQREPINEWLESQLNRTQVSREHLRWRERALGRYRQAVW